MWSVFFFHTFSHHAREENVIRPPLPDVCSESKYFNLSRDSESVLLTEKRYEIWILLLRLFPQHLFPPLARKESASNSPSRCVLTKKLRNLDPYPASFSSTSSPTTCEKRMCFKLPFPMCALKVKFRFLSASLCSPTPSLPYLLSLFPPYLSIPS